MIDMNKKDKIRTSALIISWAFTVFCMIVIFCYSNQTATDSENTSNGLIKTLFDMFGIELGSHFIRKLAHSIEFGGLCFAFNMSYAATFRKYSPFVSILSTVAYATTDEIHQYFVDGRACQLIDIFVDFCGAAAVTLVLTIFYYIFKRYKEKREV